MHYYTFNIHFLFKKKDETKYISTAKVESKIRMRDLNINRILTLCDRSKAGIDINEGSKIKSKTQ